MSEENKALSRRVIEEIFNAGNLGAADELIAQDHVHHDPAMPEEGHGPEHMKEFASMYLSAFPDTHLDIEDQIAEGDKVVTRWVASGTHEGELMGIAPTGNRVRVAGMTIDRIAEGKIVETWDNYDAMGMMRQLGAIPQLGGAIHSGRITPEEISGEGSSESVLTGGITPEEISGGRQPDTAPHEVGVPPEDISGRTPPSSAPRVPRERGIPPEDISGD